VYRNSLLPIGVWRCICCLCKFLMHEPWDTPGCWIRQGRSTLGGITALNTFSNHKEIYWPQYQFPPTSNYTFLPINFICTRITTVANFLLLIAMCLHLSCCGDAKLLDESDWPWLWFIYRLIHVFSNNFVSSLSRAETHDQLTLPIYSHLVNMRTTQIFLLFLLYVCYGLKRKAWLHIWCMHDF
jgi:hypothetical protein